MKWINRIQKGIKCGLLLMEWFAEARADGVITAEEVAYMLPRLIDAAGLSDELQIEVAPPEGLSA